jgi:GT2 family glycosyltransferase
MMMSVRSKRESLTSKAVGRVDVVVVTHGGADDLPGAIESVRNQGPVVGRMVVIDNASPDATADVAELLGVEVMRLVRNVGFAAAMNVGYHATKAAYLMSLNADARLRAGYLNAVVAALDADPRLGGASGLLVLPEGVVDSSGIELTRAFTAYERDRGAAPAEAASSEPFGVSGAAAVWRRAMLDEVGGWWDGLFVYWEDVELAWRARRRGWRFATVPGAVADHRRGSDDAPSQFIEAQSLHNRLATIARHRGWRGLLAPRSGLVTVLTVLRLLLRHPRALRDAQPRWAVWKGRRIATGAGSHPVHFAPHPWRAWLAQQVSGGRRGLGAVPSRR